MAETPQAPASPPTVTDNRPVPRGVLPRGMQTWIMAGIAVGMLAIMLLVGRSDPPVRTTSAPTACVTIRNGSVRWRRRRSAKPKPQRAHRPQP
jgi:hypothetical protein